MTSGPRLTRALRRISAAVGALFVRADDVERVERNGGFPAELHDRMVARTVDIEKRAAKLESQL